MQEKKLCYYSNACSSYTTFIYSVLREGISAIHRYCAAFCWERGRNLLFLRIKKMFDNICVHKMNKFITSSHGDICFSAYTDKEIDRSLPNSHRTRYRVSKKTSDTKSSTTYSFKINHQRSDNNIINLHYIWQSRMSGQLIQN